MANWFFQFSPQFSCIIANSCINLLYKYFKTCCFDIFNCNLLLNHISVSDFFPDFNKCSVLFPFLNISFIIANLIIYGRIFWKSYLRFVLDVEKIANSTTHFYGFCDLFPSCLLFAELVQKWRLVLVYFLSHGLVVFVCGNLSDLWYNIHLAQAWAIT